MMDETNASKNERLKNLRSEDIATRVPKDMTETFLVKRKI